MRLFKIDYFEIRHRVKDSARVRSMLRTTNVAAEDVEKAIAILRRYEIIERETFFDDTEKAMLRAIDVEVFGAVMVETIHLWEKPVVRAPGASSPSP